MRVTPQTEIDLMTAEQLLDTLREIDHEEQRLKIKLALLRGRLSGPAIPTPAWFRELL